MAVSSREKKQPTKIRKIAERSPTPNQRMAIGIHARGEIGRKIWTSRLNAISARRYQPIASPSGMAITAARRKPHVTRNREATTYFSSNPCCKRSPMPRSVCHGPGKSWPGWLLMAICQMTSRTKMNETGLSGTSKIKNHRLDGGSVRAMLHRIRQRPFAHGVAGRAAHRNPCWGNIIGGRTASIVQNDYAWLRRLFRAITYSKFREV